jgi:hypothetical protein
MKEVGLWIDHRRAVIVTVVAKDDTGAQNRKDATVTVEEVVSGMEKHVRYSSGDDVQSDVAEDQRDRRFNGHLTKYYEKVAGYLRDASSIVILGPGEAKRELQKVLSHLGKGELVTGVEAADKLTNAQIVGLVRQHFGI